MAQTYIDGGKKKSHQWAFILYPESAPKNWLQVLDDTYLKIAISPIHDRDLDLETGEIIKPHYHVMVMFGNNTTSSVADDLSLSLHQTRCIPISNAWGYFQYLDHDRETDKAKYNHKDIRLLNGLTEGELKTLTKDQERELKRSIHVYIHTRKVTEYDQLLEDLFIVDSDMYDYASSHTLLFNTIITSFRNRGKKEEMTGNSSKGDIKNENAD
jgi:Plasmid replication protein.